MSEKAQEMNSDDRRGGWGERISHEQKLERN